MARSTELVERIQHLKAELERVKQAEAALLVYKETQRNRRSLRDEEKEKEDKQALLRSALYDTTRQGGLDNEHINNIQGTKRRIQCKLKQKQRQSKPEFGCYYTKRDVNVEKNKVQKRLKPKELTSLDKKTLNFFHKLQEKSTEPCNFVKKQPITKPTIQRILNSVLPETKSKPKTEYCITKVALGKAVKLPLLPHCSRSNLDTIEYVEKLLKKVENENKKPSCVIQAVETRNGSDSVTETRLASTMDISGRDEVVKLNEKRARKLKCLLIRRYTRTLSIGLSSWIQYIRMAVDREQCNRNVIRIQSWYRMIHHKSTLHERRELRRVERTKHINCLKGKVWKELCLIFGDSVVESSSDKLKVLYERISIPGLKRKDLTMLRQILALLLLNTNTDNMYEDYFKNLEEAVHAAKSLVEKWNQCKNENIKLEERKRKNMRLLKEEIITQESVRYFMELKRRENKIKKSQQAEVETRQLLERRKLENWRKQNQKTKEEKLQRERTKLTIDEDRRNKLSLKKRNDAYNEDLERLQDSHKHEFRWNSNLLDTDNFSQVESKRESLQKELDEEVQGKKYEIRCKLRDLLSFSLKEAEQKYAYAVRHLEKVRKNTGTSKLAENEYLKAVLTKNRMEMEIEDHYSAYSECQLYEISCMQKIKLECAAFEEHLSQKSESILNSLRKRQEEEVKSLKSKYEEKDSLNASPCHNIGRPK